MSVSVPRLVAAVLALAVGGLVLVTALGIYLANAILDGGFGSISPADAATLDGIVAALPIVAVYGVTISTGGVALLVGASWARPLVAITAGLTFVAALVGVVALSLGHDPFVATGHGHTSDGIGMLLAVAIVHLVILASLAFDRPSGARASQPAA